MIRFLNSWTTTTSGALLPPDGVGEWVVAREGGTQGGANQPLPLVTYSLRVVHC